MTLPVDPSALRRGAAPDGGRRPPVRVGFLLGLAALATMLVSLVFAYFMLMFGSPAWPPAGIPRPGLVVPLAGMALLGGGAAAAALAAGRRRGLVGGLAAAIGFGAAVLAMQAAGYAGLPFRIDENAYTSLFGTLGAFHTVGLATTLWFTLATLVRAGLGHFDDEHHEGARLAALWWWWAAGSGAVLFLTLYLGPHLGTGSAP